MHSCIQSGLCFLSSAFFFYFSIHISCWLRGHCDEDPSALFVKKISLFFFSVCFFLKVNAGLPLPWKNCGIKMTHGWWWWWWCRFEPVESQNTCVTTDLYVVVFFLVFFLITVLFRLILSHLEQQQLTRWRWKTDQAHHRHGQTFPLSVEHSQFFFFVAFFFFFF